MSLPNIWHHRKVADTSAKGCEICFKPSTSVLITPDKQDFFYVCPAHLKDRGFCSPIIDHDAIAAKKKKEMDEEVERLKREYEEKQRKKKEKEAEKEKDNDKQKDKKDSKEKEEDKGEKKEDSASGDKGKSKDKSQAEVEEEPRVFALQRVFHQRRLDRKRQAEMAKRNRERLNNPNFFPSVPKDLP
ncbi:VPS4-associated protein 1 [Xylaria digitata]|nr:VPS4-associated protein 1 [Xylaria digitata]